MLKSAVNQLIYSGFLVMSYFDMYWQYMIIEKRLLKLILNHLIIKTEKMKKLFIVALLALGLNGFSQEVSSWSAKKIEKMTTELSLTAEQQKLMLPLFEEQKKYFDDIKANPDTNDANRAKIREIQKQVNAILTPEQLTRQKELKANK